MQGFHRGPVSIWWRHHDWHLCQSRGNREWLKTKPGASIAIRYRNVIKMIIDIFGLMGALQKLFPVISISSVYSIQHDTYTVGAVITRFCIMRYFQYNTAVTQALPNYKSELVLMKGLPHTSSYGVSFTLQWRHNERHGVSNHRRLNCLPNRLFKRRSKKTSMLCITGLCAGNSPVTGELSTQMASNAENVSIWWRHQ